MATMFLHWTDRALPRIDDTAIAASHFNWLVISQPLNRAMLLGDTGIPELRGHAAEGVRLFLTNYGAR